MAFELPDLPYDYNALNPHIDTSTMEIHHKKHHQAYIIKLNAAIDGTDMEGKSIEELCQAHSNVPAIRNNGGGHFNHSLFWTVMSPNGGGEPSGALANAITEGFQSFDNFKETFIKDGIKQFGSGWVWLCAHADGKVDTCSTPNQDNPLMPIVECNGTPILGMDVWEHAYYLNYQNRRLEYIQAFFNIINWGEVSKRYEEAK